MCAINSALEIDLTGQVCADSLGSNHYSGVGGQMDFMRGAALSQHGKPILVLPSETSKGVSRIVNTVSVSREVVRCLSDVFLAERRCRCDNNSSSCSLCGD